MAAKKGTRPKTPTAQDRKIKELETKIENLTWCHHELIYNMKMALAQLVLKMNPEVLQTIAAQMVAKQSQKGAPPQ